MKPFIFKRLHSSSSFKNILLNKRVLRSWIISYVIILILPLCINLYVYMQAYNTIREQAENSLQTSLVKLKSDMDKELSRYTEFVLKIAVDIDINFFLDASGMSSFSQSYATASRIFNMSESLKLYEPTESLITDYYIFSNGNDLVWHNNGISEIADCTDLSTNYTQLIEEQCQDLNMTAINIFTITPSSDSYIILTYPLPYKYIPKGYIAILLDNAQVSEYMNQVASINDSQVYLADDAYRLICSSGELTNTEVFISYDFSNNIIRENYMGEDTLFYILASDILDINYICTLPVSTATQNLIYHRNSLLISVLCTILGGGIFIAYVTKRNYSPIERLIATIKEHSSTLIEENNNEYQVVFDTLKDIYKEKATIEQVVKRQNKTLYSYYLSRLLKGNIGLLDTDEKITAEMEKQILLDNYTVLLTLTDVKSDWMKIHNEFAESAYLAFFETQFMHRLQEYLGENYSIAYAEIYDFNACIIGMKGDCTADWQTNIKSALDQIVTDLKSDYEFQYYLSLSNLHQSITEMSVAYDEAFSAISYSIMDQDWRIVFYEDIQQNEPIKAFYQSDSEQRLINLVQTGNEDGTVQVTNQLLDEIAKGQPTFESAKCAACNIMCSLTKTLEHIKASDDITFKKEYYTIIDSFMRSNSFDKLRSKLLEAAKLLCTRFQIAASDPTAQHNWIAKIDEQLDKNIYNDNLNVMFLANQLNISSKYVSSLYYEAKGVSLIDTIHKRRIEHFKELITTTDMNINDAAAAVGYISIATLNRWMKKYEGITPGQLKKMGNNNKE